MIRSSLLALALGAAGSSAFACGATTPCSINDRDYYVALPDTAEGPLPAVVFIHGWGGSGSGALKNTGMVEAFTQAGYAVIAPDGVPRAGGNGRSWAFHPQSPRQADEIAHLRAVRDEATERLGLDPDRILLAGFSIGGSMTAYTACAAPGSFAAYAPIGGNFWRPHPERCAGPVKMLHTHGWTDGTVPLEGRAVNRLPITDPNAFVQGDIFYAMQIWREANGCVHSKADRFVTEGLFWRRSWDRCTPGSALELALFPGGHVIPPEWAGLVTEWFESLGADAVQE